MSSDPLLTVDGLSISMTGSAGRIALLRDVSFVVRRGEIVGIAGESGSGKTLTAMAIARLSPPTVTVTARQLTLGGINLLNPSKREERSLGSKIGVVLQDPMSSLNPALRISTQMTEVVRRTLRVSRSDAMDQAADALNAVKVSDARRRLSQFPHQLSGGLRQRVTIATANMIRPELLIADEPTTALDVIVQAEIVQLLRDLNARLQTSIVMVSHDVALLARLCSRILVMYGGVLVEDVQTSNLLSRAEHPYTRALVAAVPRLTFVRPQRLATIPGRPPQPGSLGPGCPYQPRCQLAVKECERMPEWMAVEGGSGVACWRPLSRQTVAGPPL